MSEIAERVRGQRQRWAAPGGSHDRLVGFMAWLLPTAIGMLAAFLAVAPLTKGNELSFVLDKNKVEVAKERMRVTEAMYRGADGKNQPFLLEAGSAVQKSSADPVVNLTDLTASIRLPEGPAVLRAGQGRYDMDAEKVAVDGPLLFTAADGYRLEARDVAIDLASRTVASDRPVNGRTAQGVFSANSMRADLEKQTVVLQGRVRFRSQRGM